MLYFLMRRGNSPVGYVKLLQPSQIKVRTRFVHTSAVACDVFPNDMCLGNVARRAGKALAVTGANVYPDIPGTRVITSCYFDAYVNVPYCYFHVLKYR
jgi:hypothetical protein